MRATCHTSLTIIRTDPFCSGGAENAQNSPRSVEYGSVSISMRRRLSFFGRVVAVAVAFSSAIGATAAFAEELPEFRPALLGNGPKSLINQIDAQALAKKGQADCTVLYMGFINDRGECTDVVCYSGSPNSWRLEDEIVKKAKWSRYVAPVYQHQKVSSILFGTMIFRVKAGVAHLHSYLNQEEQHLKAGDDFIAPQPVFFRGSGFKGIHYPPEALKFSATTLIRATVDASGNLQKTELVYERPAGKGFGPAVLEGLKTAKFIPAFSHGAPVACTFNFPIIFKINRKGGESFRWRSD